MCGLAIHLDRLRTDFAPRINVPVHRGARIGSVPVSTIYGEETSSINPLRDTYRFFRLVTRLHLSTRSIALRPTGLCTR